jgi:hypothetical protein
MLEEFQRYLGKTLEIFNREKTYDRTNDEGMYYLVIPKDIQKYNLVFRADNYWSKVSKEFDNNHDPEKMKKIVLRKKDVLKDSQDINELSRLLNVEVRIAQRSASNETRQAIKSDLERFLNELKRKQADPRAIMLADQAVERLSAFAQ